MQTRLRPSTWIHGIREEKARDDEEGLNQFMVYLRELLWVNSALRRD